MRKPYLIFAAGLIAAALFAAGIELVANALYYSKRGKLFYLDKQRSPRGQAGAYTAAEAVFHPYYSYIHRVGRSGPYRSASWTTNNVGFQVVTTLVQADPHCCDYPMKKREGEVLVGIFGGSVASGFALTAQSSPEFADRLARIPAWAGKRVRIFNFAMPGFKQPQQLITLAYYLSLGQHFDLVLNIDGFNEVVTSHRNWASGVEPSFPADTLWGEWAHILEKRAAAVEEGNGETYLAAYYKAAAREWKRRGDACSVAACYAYFHALADIGLWRASRLEVQTRKAEQKATLFPTPITMGGNEKLDVFDYAADQWAASSREMAQLVGAAGGTYLHVIQPNQWWRKAGNYQPIDRDHIYKWVIDLIDAGYPKLVSRVPALAGQGVAVLDATMLFGGMPDREIYSDDCCHYTEKGDSLFGARIAEQVAKIFARPASPAAPKPVR